jgi:hypothetical protein
MIRIQVAVEGTDMMRRLAGGLRQRGPLHARIAVETRNYVRDYVQRLDSRPEEHRTANRLGATPTNHLATAAKGIESESDERAAILKVPRASRLRAAFGTYTIRPKNGKKYLTIPDNARTYGKRVAEIREPLHFRMVGGRHKALCFKDGTVAYWLREQVTIKEDRTLLPFAQLPRLCRRVAVAYIEEITNPEGTPA